MATDFEDRLRRAASFEVPPAPPSLPRRRGAHAGATVGLTAFVILIIALSGIGLASTRSNDSGLLADNEVAAPSAVDAWAPGPCAPPASRPDSVSDELRTELDLLRAVVEAERAEGWRRVRLPAVDGSWMCGWTRDLANPIADGGAAPNGPIPVFGAMDLSSAPLGYELLFVGFVKADIVDDPAFDAAELRIEANGCDPLADQMCEPRS
jgi:hypothetical protein